MPGKLFKNSTGQVRVQFVNDLTGDQIITGTVTVTITHADGSVAVNAGAMAYDASQELRPGWPTLGCWTYTVSSAALTVEEEVTVQYDISSSGMVGQVVETIPVEVNTGR